MYVINYKRLDFALIPEGLHLLKECYPCLPVSQQISCPHESRNYSDEKIEQFKQRVDQLKKEHQKFVAKVQRLDPSYQDTIPWQPRGYNRKRSHGSHVMPSDFHTSGSASKKLCSPLLEKEQKWYKQSHESHLMSHDVGNCIPSIPLASNPGDKQEIDTAAEGSGFTTLECGLPKTTPNLLGLEYSSSEDEN